MRRRDLKVSRTLHGTVLPVEQGQVLATAPNDGSVTKVLVQVGDRVIRGQTLVHLNTVFGQSGLQVIAQLEQSQSALNGAQQDLISARSQLAEAEADLGQFRSALSLARSNLGQAQAENHAAQRDLDRKRQALVRELFSQTELDEALARAEKSAAIRTDAEDQVKIALSNLPLAEKRVGEASQAVQFNRQQLALAQANYRRQSSILSQAGLVGSQLDPRLSQALLPPWQLTPAEARAAEFEVRAPIDGVVTDLKATLGLKVASGDCLATITDISTLYVEASAYESDLVWLQPGLELTCFSPGRPERKLKGRVHYLSRVVDPVTRSISLRARLKNPDGWLRPSMYVEALIQPAHPSQVLVAPEKAILNRGEELYVLVYHKDSPIERRSVTIGASSQGLVEILTGLQEGEEVITGGNLLIDQRDPSQ
ncbi:efflux RND transporter periplasmic adaptor subunit [bacterium]|nr:efflux RND transporter periplasmic adaptor subunit [bacterium]